MSLPSPSLTLPSLASYQLSYRGLTFGGLIEGAAYQLQKLDGLENPEVNSGDTQRPLDQGELPGVDDSKGRDVTVTQVVQSDGISLDHARQALEAAMTLGGNTEEPLYLKLPSGLFACMARPRKHSGPSIDVTTVVAGGGVATSMFHATDPRWYAMPTKTATVGLPAQLGGLSFGGPGSGISFGGPASGISFGGGSTGGLLQVENNGRVEMRPVFVITGPCVNPVVSNLSIPGAPSIGFNLTLNPGDTLEVETDLQRVLLTTAGTSGAASRRGTLLPGSIWWNLPAGSNTIEFTTSDASQVTGTLTVLSADAYLGL